MTLFCFDTPSGRVCMQPKGPDPSGNDTMRYYYSDPNDVSRTTAIIDIHRREDGSIAEEWAYSGDMCLTGAMLTRQNQYGGTTIEVRHYGWGDNGDELLIEYAQFDSSGYSVERWYEIVDDELNVLDTGTVDAQGNMISGPIPEETEPGPEPEPEPDC